MKLLRRRLSASVRPSVPPPAVVRTQHTVRAAHVVPGDLIITSGRAEPVAEQYETHAGALIVAGAGWRYSLLPGTPVTVIRTHLAAPPARGRHRRCAA